MSRKTIGFIVAIVGAILVAFQEQFGLSLNPAQVAAGIGAILTYVFFEAKLDLKALTSQPDRWKDPKFWLTVLSALLAVVEQTFQFGIPVTEVVAVLTLIVGILFKAQFSKTVAY